MPRLRKGNKSMIKRHIIEENYEYDESGRVTRKTVTTTEEHDDNYYGGNWWQQWNMPPQIICLPPEDMIYLGGSTEFEN